MNLRTTPFQDGYNIEEERQALKDLLESDEPDVNDPRWPRLVEFYERVSQLRKLQSVYAQRKGADAVVPDDEAVAEAGGLIDDEPDQMVLHTKEAHRLFIGRARDPQGNHYPIIGGKRVAAALRSIWYLSGNDNPYADWALIDTSKRIEGLKSHLNDIDRECSKRLKAAANKGLVFSVLKSRQPVTVKLGFRSPYGYTIASLLVDFDYQVRQIKTLVRKDLMADEEGRLLIRDTLRKIRGTFEVPVRFERYLMRAELRALSRSDWLPGADDEAVKRVSAAVGIFGEVPKDIFTGAVAPRHSRRRVHLSEQELNLLQQVASGTLEVEAEGEDSEALL